MLPTTRSRADLADAASHPDWADEFFAWRVVPNGDGVDLLWTLSRPPGLDDAAWQAGGPGVDAARAQNRARHTAGRS